MCGSVDQAVHHNKSARDFMKVDMPVQWQDDSQAHFSQFGDTVAQHEHQNEHGSEVEALTAGPGQNDPPVAGVVIVFEVPILVKTGHEKAQIDQNKKDGK